MTVGNYVRNKQTSVALDFGVANIGLVTTRWWDGEDRPVFPHVDRPRLDEAFIDWSKKGRVILDKKILANNRDAIAAYKRAVKDIQARRLADRIINGRKPHRYSTTKSWEDVSYDFYKKPGWASALTGSPIQLGGNPILFWPSQWTANDDIVLASRLKTAILGSDFHAGVFINELLPAISMITNAASRLYNARRHLLKGRVNAAWKALSPAGAKYAPKVRRGQPIAEQWLEMSFGWKPLVSDLEAGAQMIAHNDSVPFSYTARARLKKGDNKVDVREGSNKIFFTGVKKETGQIVAYLTEVNVPKLIGLTDSASIAWERMPFSFLGDYVIPIGNYLAARGVAQALKGEFVTSRRTVKSVTGFESRDMPIVSTPRSKLEKWTMECTRSISTSLEVPLPSVKPLGEIGSWKRAANVVSLLITTGSVSKLNELRNR